MADGLRVIDPHPVWKDMKKAGRSLFRSLGELRDVQVMAEWVQELDKEEDSEKQALLSLLATREQTHKLTAAEAIRSFDLRQWRKWSRELPRRAARVKPGSLVFKHLALERWTEAYELHRRAMRNRSQVALHQLRIGIKRFRYIVENFLPQQHAAWSADLKELQDLLGDVHDLDVLWATAIEVNAFGSAESRARWQSIVQAAREKRVERYRERMVGSQSLWQIWRADLPEGKQIQAAAKMRIGLWSQFLDPEPAHARRVAALAHQLFDGLAKLGLAPSSANQDLQSVLQAAALLHDVGRSKHDKEHEKVSYRMIRGFGPPLGRSSSELHLAAVTARFHRGTFPTMRHKALRDLALDQKKIALQLSGILRLANAFDSESRGRIQKVSVESRDHHLIVQAQGYRAWSREAEKIAAASYLLELSLRQPIVVKPLLQARPKTPSPSLRKQSPSR